MDQNKSLEYDIDQFKMINAQLENMDKNIDQEDQTIILLNSLPETFSELKIIIKYVREDLSFDFVVASLRSWENEHQKLKKSSNSRDRKFVRGISYKIDSNNKDKSHSRSKSRNIKNIKFVCCPVEGHIKRDYPMRNRQGSEKKGKIML